MCKERTDQDTPYGTKLVFAVRGRRTSVKRTDQDVAYDAQLVLVIRGGFGGVVVVLCGVAQDAHFKGLPSDLTQVLLVPVGRVVLLCNTQPTCGFEGHGHNVHSKSHLHKQCGFEAFTCQLALHTDYSTLCQAVWLKHIHMPACPTH